MRNANIITSFLLAIVLFLTQFAVAFAAQPSDKAPSISGAVAEVSMVTDPNTGITIVHVKITDQAGVVHTVQISEKTAAKLGLIDYDSADGNPVIVDPPPSFVDIDSKSILTDEEPRHPVASALATFFSDIDGINYDVIMEAHGEGFGFGFIAQALWLVEKMGGTLEDFVLLLDAKKNNNFSDFKLKDGTVPTSWGELKKAVAEKQLGSILSKRDKDKPSNSPSAASSANANGAKDKDKNKDKPTNGTGNNGQGKGNGNGNGNKP